MKLKGTELLAHALKCEGVDTIFGYPGGYVIDIFDELYKQNDIEIILPRHEQGLVHATDGYARSTGKVGVCIVTSGPGATNIVTGIATANYDSVPIVCFTGQVPTPLIGNDAFQEVDIVSISGSICKHAIMVKDRKDLNRAIKEAFYIARSGRPGPVVVDLPKDIMLTLGDGDYPETVSIRGYKPTKDVHIGQLQKAIHLLQSAKKPLFLIGGGVNISGGGELLTKLIELTNVPVVTTIMGKGAIDTKHERYIDNLGMHGTYASNYAVSNCDLLFSIGTRFNDRITGKVSEFAPNAKIVHIDIDSASISRNVKVDIPIVADAKLAIEQLIKYATLCDIDDWNNQIDLWKKENECIMATTKDLTPQSIFKKLNETFEDGFFVTDVGQHQMWSTQYLELNNHKKLLTSGGLGTMGFGLPASIGASIGNIDRSVICITGDGGFQMNIQELATAVMYDLPIVICVFNNSYLGMVRQWQELFYDKRYSITCLKRRKSCPSNCYGPSDKCPKYVPDFIKIAESYGIHGIRVGSNDDMDKAFEYVLKNKNKTVLIEFIIKTEELVLPMVQGGKSLKDMILKN